MLVKECRVCGWRFSARVFTVGFLNFRRKGFPFYYG